MKTKNTKRSLLLSGISLLLCASMFVGSTFAWFTDTVSSGRNTIQSGNLDVELYYFDTEVNDWAKVTSETDVFGYTLWEPGFTKVVKFKVVNEGTLALKYQLTADVFKETAGKNKIGEGETFLLSDYLYTKVVDKDADRATILATTGASNLKDSYSMKDGGELVAKGKGTSEEIIALAIWMPTTVGNEANHNGTDIPKIEFGVNLVATQLTNEEDSFDELYDKDAEYPSETDEWDGTTNITWYLKNPAAETFTLSSAEELAGLATLVDGSAVIPVDVASEITLPVTFAGKTIVLDGDVDLEAYDENGEKISFEPIGSYNYDQSFMGTFDGQGHTISNMYQNGWALENGVWDGDDLGLGIFGKVKNATIKNLKIDGANQPSEANLIGTVAGAAYGDCVFENITVTNSYMGNHSYYSGGIVGWASGNHQYIGINIDNSNVISSQWGDFNNANGGIIGGAGSSGTYSFKDCNIACIIDTYNDYTSAYEWCNYRNSGMIIGRTGHTATSDAVTTVAAPNVTCENVTVTFGSWAEYHYCEFGSSSYPWCRVEAGESTGAYGNARVGEYYDANGALVVDDSHVHNDGEGHNLMLEFTYLFGGPAEARYCQYGLSEFEGVTVNKIN